MNNLILLSGKVGNGKSTLAKELASVISNAFVCPIGFQVKMFVQANFQDLPPFDAKNNFTRILWEEVNPKFNIDNKVGPLLLRELYQIQGELQKEFCKDFWTARWYEDIQSSKLLLGWDNSTFIVDDWRFVHEFEYFKLRFINLVKVRINRPEAPKVYPGCNHISEIELDNYQFDINFENSGDNLELNGYLLSQKIKEFFNNLSKGADIWRS